MSISDLIVVMKDGVIHQVGKPQDVYDDPADLFVAKFLGTPPVNVFRGRIEDEQLFIGNEKVLHTPGVADQDVFAAIRPEGFELNENGALTCNLHRVEVMGRDVSVVCSHADCDNTAIRAIISADNLVNATNSNVCFDLKAHKVHIFDVETQQRIVFDAL